MSLNMRQPVCALSGMKMLEVLGDGESSATAKRVALDQQTMRSTDGGDASAPAVEEIQVKGVKCRLTVADDIDSVMTPEGLSPVSTYGNSQCP